jgi:hypothetical protein
VTCIAFSPNGCDIATSENGDVPVTYIWNALTMQIKTKIVGNEKNGLTEGMMTLAFSPPPAQPVLPETEA